MVAQERKLPRVCWFEVERIWGGGTDLGRLGGAFAPGGTAEALFFFFDSDAEGFQELHVLIADFEFGIGRESGNQGSLVGGFFALLADADGGFENQEYVVSAFFDAGDDFGDLFGIGERLVDGFAEFLHELFELLVHLVPPIAGCLAPNIPTIVWMPARP